MTLLFFVITLLVIAVVALYVYVRWTLVYWERRGVQTYPLNILDIRNGLIESYFYLKSLDLKHGGFYTLLKAVYVPIDLEIIRLILLRDFDHFINHGGYVNEKIDPLCSHLFAMSDEKWKNLRSKLTPAFTSDFLKKMFPTMVKTTKPLSDFLQNSAAHEDPVDIKDTVSRLITDVLVQTCFGTDCNSINNPECEFRKYVKEIEKFDWKTKAIALVPESILRFLNIGPRNKSTDTFFIKMVKDVIKNRESNKIYKPDFMHVILQLKNRGKFIDDEKIFEDNIKGEYMKLTEIAAQCYAFFVGGLEPSSTLITLTLLELVNHQDVQEKLRKEMKTIVNKHSGITYEAITEMSYLDQVISEILRLHPPYYTTTRVCNKSFLVPEQIVVLDPGTQILIPIYAIHHDPDYYPDPLKFDPDRFSPEKKAGRHPFTFIPFGEGPRMCIGQNFGLLIVKLALISFVTNFKVTLNPRTKSSVDYTYKGCLSTIKGDVWLNFSKPED